MQRKDPFNKYGNIARQHSGKAIGFSVVGAIAYGIYCVFSSLSEGQELREKYNDEMAVYSNAFEYYEDGATFKLKGKNAIKIEYGSSTNFTVDFDDRSVITHGSEGAPPSASSFDAFNDAGMIDRARRAGCFIVQEKFKALPADNRFIGTDSWDDAAKAWGPAFARHCPAP